MSLDNLYGQGAFSQLQAALHAAIPTCIVGESSNPDGSVHIEVTWLNNSGRMEFYSDRVRVTYLSTTCNGNIALREASGATFKAVSQNVIPVIQSFGIHKIEALLLDNLSKSALLNSNIDQSITADGLALTWDL